MNKVSAESMLARMKTNHSSFELIPEEGEESMQDNTVTSVSASLKQKLSEPCVTTTTTCGTNAIPVENSLQKGGQQPGHTGLPHSDNTVAGSMAQAQQVDFFRDRVRIPFISMTILTEKFHSRIELVPACCTNVIVGRFKLEDLSNSL